MSSDYKGGSIPEKPVRGKPSGLIFFSGKRSYRDVEKMKGPLDARAFSLLFVLLPFSRAVPGLIDYTGRILRLTIMLGRSFLYNVALLCQV
jgi:hypothetical protein